MRAADDADDLRLDPEVAERLDQFAAGQLLVSRVGALVAFAALEHARGRQRVVDLLGGGDAAEVALRGRCPGDLASSDLGEDALRPARGRRRLGLRLRLGRRPASRRSGPPPRRRRRSRRSRERRSRRPPGPRPAPRSARSRRRPPGSPHHVGLRRPWSRRSVRRGLLAPSASSSSGAPSARSLRSPWRRRRRSPAGRGRSRAPAPRPRCRSAASRPRPASGG